jgi:hypothetical protein
VDQRWRAARIPEARLLGLAGYLAVLALAAYFYMMPALDPSEVRSAAQGPAGRIWAQMLAYLLVLMYFYVASRIGGEAKDTILFCKAYVAMTASLAVYGVYQVAAYYYGLPYRGVIYAPELEGMGLFSVEGLVFPRVNSLANEPKQLAMVLLPSIVAIGLVRGGLWPSLRCRLTGWLSLSLHLVIFMLTFSTGGFMAAILIAPLVLILVWRWYPRRAWRLGAVGLVSVAVMALGAAVISHRVGLVKLLTAHPMEVLEDVRVEHHLLEYLAWKPGFLIFGMGPGNYTFRLEELGNRLFGEHGVNPVDSALLSMVADIGVIGTFWLLVCLTPPFRLAAKALKNAGGESADLLRGLVCMLLGAAVQLPFVGVLPLFAMLGGVTTGRVRNVLAMKLAAPSVPIDGHDERQWRLRTAP